MENDTEKNVAENAEAPKRGRRKKADAGETGARIESRVYYIKGITPLLGSQPASQSVRTQYLLSKIPDEVREERMMAEAEDYVLPEEDDKNLTVFLRDPTTGAIGIMDYVFKGFFKEALGAMKCFNQLTAHKKKVDLFLFTENPMGKTVRAQRIIPVLRNGKLIKDEDDINERPLRADTAQGPRTTVIGSEMINDPWEMVVRLTLLPNSSTPLTWAMVEGALNYGRYRGLGQWRNGSYGRFLWKQIEDKWEETRNAF